VLVVPDREAGRGCTGDKLSIRAQAAVPGSSDPSGQSQVLSLTCEALMTMEGWAMQAKVSLIS
jgi:hypothetical protein